ncbi:MAG: putative zinc-binding peptidase [Zoogloeaceae bacterium]|nr:putative zinc-binding peptidase [Zoogloeaceae bacterium]
MKIYQCTNCGQGVYFDNTHCQSCGSALGYLPEKDAMMAFDVPQADGLWPARGEHGMWRPCDNYVRHQVCNWMLSPDEPGQLCASCRHTEVLPPLGEPGMIAAWARVEGAKRRMLHTLDRLALAHPTLADDPEGGLRFHFLTQKATTHKVLTGHDAGLITLSVEEAEDATREARRAALGEPYRTLLGHFRHEIGHFYWDRLIGPGAWLASFRDLFGDEREDYAEALKRHYDNGPAEDWPTRFVSAYASSHPWEDWAETWAHYLHIADGLETAEAWGVSLVSSPHNPADSTPERNEDAFVRRLRDDWLPLSRFLNSMNRSLGHPDAYPFVLADPVVEKLGFVHRLCQAAGGLGWTSWPPPAAD